MKILSVGSEIQIVEMTSNGVRQRYKCLCIEWWKWLLSMPSSLNPVNDMNGKFAHMGQTNENLFFLAQTIESANSTPNRTIQIKKGDFVFMPILNWISIQDSIVSSDEELADLAKEKMDNVGNLTVHLNKVPLNRDFRKFRIQTPPFEVFLPAENVLGLPSGTARIISDGYWLFFKPFLKKFEIGTYGSCSSGLTKIRVNYTIKVIK